MSDSLIIFDLSDKSEDFVLGLEAGKLWEKFSDPMHEEVAGACHEANRAVVESLAASKDWGIEFTDAGDGVWLSFVARRMPASRPRLRVVQ